MEAKEYWKKYEAVVKYNSGFKPDKNYYEAIKVWNGFYNGDQWQGIDGDNSLPHPTFNITRRIIEFKVASLTSADISVNIEPLEYTPKAEDSQFDISDFINSEIRNLLEKFNFRTRKKELLIDAAVTGDMCIHTIFNSSAKPYRGDSNVLGEIEIELIDATNVGFGNSNIKDVQKQPWILIVGRDTVKNLKKEAKDKKEAIRADNDTGNQVSEYASEELEIQADDEGKALYIYLYEKDDNGNILVTKCTQDAIIYEKVNTNLTRYPIAFSNWYTQKGTYHGRGEVEGIAPNQIAINKMYAMIIYHQMTTAFPTAVYDGEILDKWTNKLGVALKVKGLAKTGRSFKDIAGYIEPANMSDYIIKVIDQTFQYTKECMGVSDASLGQVDPKNTSAIIAVQKSTAVPLANIKDNFYDLVEQFTLILIDMMASKYGIRPVLISNEDDGSRQLIPFDFSVLKNMDLKVGVDVGDSTYFSEIAQLQTMDNLLSNGFIEFEDYIERLPNDMFPRKQELITKIKEAQKQQKAEIYEQIAQVLDTLPPEYQQRLSELITALDNPQAAQQQAQANVQVAPESEAIV